MCDECTATFTIFHGINEVLVKCQECDSSDSMRKLLSTPIVIKDDIAIKKNKVGELTKKYIEENREILQQQKENTKIGEYD